MSTTPRTDDLQRPAWTFDADDQVVSAEMMRMIERELAEARKDSARLDWLEFRGPWEAWSEPCGEAEITLRGNIRASIDSARMKEGA